MAKRKRAKRARKSNAVRKVGRDSGSGQFAGKEAVAADPDGTETQTVRVPRPRRRNPPSGICK